MLSIEEVYWLLGERDVRIYQLLKEIDELKKKVAELESK